MKILKILINKCFDCPHLQSIWVNEHKCSFAQRKIPHSEIVLGVPKWCPLENYNQ